MGFFDSVIPADKSASAGGQSSSAIAEPVAAPAVANDADFLIIDENVTVSDVPDTVSIVSEMNDQSEAAPLLDFSSVETAVPETAEVETAPAVAEVEMTDIVNLAEDSIETAMEPALTVAEAEPAMEPALTVAEAEPTAPVSDTLDPDQILLSTVEQLKGVVSSKESARDRAMSENETILAELAAEEEAFKTKKAELKARASEAQERAREIDASADRARSLISNLESQLARAA